MPVTEGSETGIMPGTYNYFYRWGRTGKKYYFNPTSEVSRMTAKDNATKQGDAIRQSLAKRKIIA